MSAAQPMIPHASQARRHRTKLRMDFASRLRVQGYSQRQIAQILTDQGLGPISQQAVGRYIKRLDEEAMARFRQNGEKLKAEQVSRLSYLYHEACTAWEKSKEASKVTRERTVEQPPALAPEEAPSPRLATTKRESHFEQRENTGDPRYLEAARAALADMRKVQGLDAPEKKLVGALGPVEDGPLRFDLTRLSVEQLKVLQALLGDVLHGGEGSPALLALLDGIMQDAPPIELDTAAGLPEETD